MKFELWAQVLWPKSLSAPFSSHAGLQPDLQVRAEYVVLPFFFLSPSSFQYCRRAERGPRWQMLGPVYATPTCPGCVGPYWLEVPWTLA